MWKSIPFITEPPRRLCPKSLLSFEKRLYMIHFLKTSARIVRARRQRMLLPRVLFRALKRASTISLRRYVLVLKVSNDFLR